MSQPPFPPEIPLVASLAPLAADRRALLVDIWGVMHNGVKPFLPAAEACQRFRETGGTILLLSNAPRPAPSVVEQLNRIGVPRDAYDAVLTSGDASREMIRQAAERGRKLGHLGPERDLALFEGVEHGLVSLEEAETVVCTGLFDDEHETPQSYADILAHLARFGADMICANPDITVERGGRIVYCAGALAQAYEQLGGAVAYAGKPHPPVYRLAFARIARMRGAEVPLAEMLAIGDGVFTDIAGAAAAGVESVYVASGVHLGAGGRLDSDALSRLFADVPGRPIAAMTALAW